MAREKDVRHQDIVFGEIIRARRIAAGMNQASLGELCCVSYQQVQKYEKGANRIAISRLFDLAAALKTTPSELLAEAERLLVSPKRDGDS